MFGLAKELYRKRDAEKGNGFYLLSLLVTSSPLFSQRLVIMALGGEVPISSFLKGGGGAYARLRGISERINLPFSLTTLHQHNYYQRPADGQVCRLPLAGSILKEMFV